MNNEIEKLKKIAIAIMEADGINAKELFNNSNIFDKIMAHYSDKNIPKEADLEYRIKTCQKLRKEVAESLGFQQFVIWNELEEAYAEFGRGNIECPRTCYGVDKKDAPEPEAFLFTPEEFEVIKKEMGGK